MALSHDYVDATLFGDKNKTYLSSKTTVTIDYTYDDPLASFDYDVARKLYADDPVVIAIIDRMETLEYG